MSIYGALLNCPNCGAPRHGAVCEYCGTWFDPEQTSETVLYADDQPVMVVARPSPSKFTSLLGAMASIGVSYNEAAEAMKRFALAANNEKGGS